MSGKKITVIICPADREPYIAEMENDLKAFQKAVGGNIEPHGEGDVIALIHEEGRLLGLPENPALLGTAMGDAVIVGVKGEEFADIPEEQAKDTLTMLTGFYKAFRKYREENEQ